ncbi:hypothetical protein FOZ63_005007, partial [Perkinsus olseni]
MGLNGAGVSLHFVAEKFCCLESRGERVRSILCVQRLAMPGTPSTTHSSDRLSDECVKVVVRSRPELPSDNRSHCVEKPNQSLTAQFGLPSPDEPGAGAFPWYTVDPIDKTVQVDSSISSYSNVFGPEATQEDVYNATVGEVLDSVL